MLLSWATIYRFDAAQAVIALSLHWNRRTREPYNFVTVSSLSLWQTAPLMSLCCACCGTC